MSIDLSGSCVLVMGGGGFIGRCTVESLLKAGARVRVIDIAGQQAADAPESRNLDWIVGSVADEALIASSAQMCDAAIFLASNSLPASANSDLAGEIGGHVRTAVKAAELCDAQGVGNFIFSSSGGTVYGLDSTQPLRETDHTRPKNAYGVSKLAVENYLRVLSSLRSMRCLSLRISNPFGAGQIARRGQGFIAAAMEHAFTGEPLTIWGDGSTVRDFVHLPDVADALVRATRYKGGHAVINIGSGRGHSLLEIVSKVEATTGRKIDLKLEPDRPIDVLVNILDVSLAAQELDWRPAPTLDEGLAATARWWRERG